MAKILRVDVWGVREAWPVLPKRIVSDFQGTNVEAPVDVHGVCRDAGHLPAAPGRLPLAPPCSVRLQSVSCRPAVATLARAGNVPLHQASFQKTLPVLASITTAQAAVPFSYALNGRFPTSIYKTGSAGKMNSRR